MIRIGEQRIPTVGLMNVDPVAERMSAIEHDLWNLQQQVSELRNTLASYVTKEAAHRARNATRQKAYRERRKSNGMA